MISLKKCSIESIPLINALAHSIWPDTYKNVISAEQIDYMLELMYSERSLLDQIQNKKHQFIMAYDGNIPVGYISYSPKIMNNIESQKVYRLHKLYVAVDQQGKGIGKLLLNKIIEILKPLGITQLELNVNKNNPAYHFYLRSGFTVAREEMLDIGDGFFMDDYVMQMMCGCDDMLKS